MKHFSRLGDRGTSAPSHLVYVRPNKFGGLRPYVYIGFNAFYLLIQKLWNYLQTNLPFRCLDAKKHLISCCKVVKTWDLSLQPWLWFEGDWVWREVDCILSTGLPLLLCSNLKRIPLHSLSFISLHSVSCFATQKTRCWFWIKFIQKGGLICHEELQMSLLPFNGSLPMMWHLV